MTQQLQTRLVKLPPAKVKKSADSPGVASSGQKALTTQVGPVDLPKPTKAEVDAARAWFQQR